MAFIGKEYILDRQDGFEEFLNALSDLSADAKKAILNHKPTVKFTKDGDKYTMTSLAPTGQLQTVTFQSGVTFDENIHGKTSKTTFTVEGNTVTQEQKFDTGTITMKREFSDNTMVMTVTASAWNGSAKRYYKLA